MVYMASIYLLNGMMVLKAETERMKEKRKYFAHLHCNIVNGSRGKLFQDENVAIILFLYASLNHGIYI